MIMLILGRNSFYNKIGSVTFEINVLDIEFRQSNWRN